MRAIIFDMDGVLVDTERINRLGFDDYLAQLGETPSKELFAITVGRRQVDFIDELSQLLGHPSTEVDRGLLAATEARRTATPLQPMPRVREALATAAADGRPMALASGSDSAFIGRVLSELGIGHLFEAIASGDEVALGKPDPAIYLLAAERLGVAASACAAIEDSPPGVAAAKAAGMFCVGVPNLFTSTGSLADADLVAGDLLEAVEMVLAMDQNANAR